MPETGAGSAVSCCIDQPELDPAMSPVPAQAELSYPTATDTPVASDEEASGPGDSRLFS